MQGSQAQAFRRRVVTNVFQMHHCGLNDIISDHRDWRNIESSSHDVAFGGISGAFNRVLMKVQSARHQELYSLIELKIAQLAIAVLAEIAYC